MSFSSMMKDKVSVLKKDGKKFEDIPASVQSKGIYIMGIKTPLIESGDLVHRKMSNGGEETYEVIDPGFHESFGGIPPSYQMKVRKLGLVDAQKAVQSITFNINGHNTRINQSSVDSSYNVVNVNPEAMELISSIRLELERLKLTTESTNEVMDALAEQFRQDKPKKSIVSALIAALPDAISIAASTATLLTLAK